MTQKSWWIRYSLCLAGISLGHLAYSGYFTSLPSSTKDIPGDLVAWLQQDQPDSKGLVWLNGYQNGNLILHREEFAKPRRPALRRWSQETPWQTCELVELGMATKVERLGSQNPGLPERGLWGLWLACPKGYLCFSPSYFAQQPQDLQATYTQIQSTRGVLQTRKFQAQIWRTRPKKEMKSFSESQWLAQSRSDLRLDSDQLTWSQLESSTHLLAGYQLRQLGLHHGLLPYRWTIAEEKSHESGRILVRNCLGSWSLARYAKWTERSQDIERVGQHLSTMATRYAHWQGDQVFIADNDTCYLGSQALFGLALLYQPKLDNALVRVELGLAKAIKNSLQAEGYFQTSVNLPGSPPSKPLKPEQDGNQDFFPGETLTYLAQRGELETFARALPYYQDRFRRLPHPAAVPWLTQACCVAYSKRANPEWAQFAFQCTDWILIELQPFELMSADLRGSPINPGKQNIGPFSASSGAGVQLEGLVHAYDLASRLSDRPRQERYLKAIREVSRYLWQMQIREPEQLYWLESGKRGNSLGGIRDLPWDYRVQIDSTAHALNAWVRLLELHPGAWQ